MEVNIEVDLVLFETRFDLAKYLDSTLTDSGLKNFDRGQVQLVTQYFPKPPFTGDIPGSSKCPLDA